MVSFIKNLNGKILPKIRLGTSLTSPLEKETFFFHKIFNKKEPVYVFNLISTKTKSNYNTKNTEKATLFHRKSNYFKNFFSIQCYWMEHAKSSKSVTFHVSKKKLLTFIKSCPNSVFNFHHWNVIKYRLRPRIGLSHLREHNFKHCFQNICIYLVQVVIMLRKIDISSSLSLNQYPKMYHLKHSKWYW